MYPAGSVTSAAFATSPAIGRKIIVLAWTWASGTPAPTMTVSDSAGNTYSADAQATTSVSGIEAAGIFSASVTATGANFKITVSSGNTGSDIVGVALEYDDVGARDQSGTASGTSAAPSVSTTGATTAWQELVVAAVNSPSPVAVYSTMSPGAGFTERVIELDNNNFEVGEGADRIVIGTGTQSITWSSSPSSSGWVAAIATYAIRRRVMIVGDRQGPIGPPIVRRLDRAASNRPAS